MKFKILILCIFIFIVNGCGQKTKPKTSSEIHDVQSNVNSYVQKTKPKTGSKIHIEHNDIHFSYRVENEVAIPFKAKILLKTPDRQILNLYTGTINDYEFSEANFFNSKGKYMLSIFFESKKYGADSLNYDFDLTGKELNVSISVSFYYREKVLRGSIGLKKYYNAPKNVKIQLESDDIGNEWYRGPFFKIKNNSSDTFYGEYLPGYFWGTLSYIRNDSILRTSIGHIDTDFVDSPPLYPNSTKIATVGSFGIPRKLVPFEYRFEVVLAKKWQELGNKAKAMVHKERQNVVWSAGIEEYYKLCLDFKVDK